MRAFADGDVTAVAAVLRASTALDVTRLEHRRMADNAQSTQIKVTNALLLLIEKEVMQTPQLILLAGKHVRVRAVRILLAPLQPHLLVDQRPHLRAPDIAINVTDDRCRARERRRRGQVMALRAGAQVLQCRVDFRHDAAEVPFFFEVHGFQRV